MLVVRIHNLPSGMRERLPRSRILIQTPRLLGSCSHCRITIVDNQAVVECGMLLLLAERV